MSPPTERRTTNCQARLWLSLLGSAVALIGLIGSRTTARPPARALFLLIAAGGLAARWIGQRRRPAQPATPGEAMGREVGDGAGDLMVFIAAGICAGGTEGPMLGLGTALAAGATEWVRLLGRSLGTGPAQAGPMGMGPRLLAMTVACVGGAGVVFIGRYLHQWMAVALAVIGAGCVVTCIRRIGQIASELGSPPGDRSTLG